MLAKRACSSIIPNMAEDADIDLRAAFNAISDVVQNRPKPLRVFDQIYMKAGDMVLQSELVARWANGKKLAFIGDGDAISVCVAYLHKREIINYGPSEIAVFDFDERICGAVTRFADNERLDQIRAELYNCLDAFPGPTDFDCFYTNPPWGASNDGESVKVFLQRGLEATGYVGEGMVVIADDPDLDWPKRVLSNVQTFAIQSGFFVQRMMPQLHYYHLDDAPNLRSCNLIFKALPGNRVPGPSCGISDPARLAHFYGRDNPPRVRYVREKERLDYGKAHEDEYSLELLEDSHGTHH
jgi:predicted methyltransferase